MVFSQNERQWLFGMEVPGVDLNWFDYCVQSILSQTYDNFELILVNDGSDDNSLEICRKWEKKIREFMYLTRKIKGQVRQEIQACNI